jgi:hypothetical protein
MEFKVFQDKNKEEKQYFKLREDISNNSIELVAVNREGISLIGGCVLDLSSKGLFLHSNLSSKIGLPLGIRECVQIRNR